MISDKAIKQCLVKPGGKFRLADHDPAWLPGKEFRKLDTSVLKERSQAIMEENLKELTAAQELLYADNRYSILVILQAMDAAGKDSTIKHVMSGVNPQGCQVFSFKQPSAEEVDHNFLWRYMRHLPERGRIGIFNRSYYEDVLVVKVHPKLLPVNQLPRDKVDKSFWKERYEDINAFERHLVRNGTVILKFFLHVSKDEQKGRFLERLERPEKNWKFSVADLAEREYWDDYQKAYQQALSATSTAWAPWYVIPADRKWLTRILVADILTDAIGSLDLAYPEPGQEERAALAAAMEKLLSE
jgi:PPK2 family polyphosphate:nucleotide phosphotransferase